MISLVHKFLQIFNITIKLNYEFQISDSIYNKLDALAVAKYKQAKHIWQWYWDRDWLGRKYKAIYFGPRINWMKKA